MYTFQIHNLATSTDTSMYLVDKGIENTLVIIKAVEMKHWFLPDRASL